MTSIKEKFELAIIGNKASILLYKSLGVKTNAISDVTEAQSVLEELVNKYQDEEKTIAEYAVIFMEENYYKELPEDLIDRLSKRALPALIPVPSPDSNDPRFGLKRISKIVERAVGSDIS